jgi:hypothetical protein
MCLFMVRSNVDPGRSSEVESAIERAFAALAEGRSRAGPAARGRAKLRGDPIRGPSSDGPPATASMTTERYAPDRSDLRGVVLDG